MTSYLRSIFGGYHPSQPTPIHTAHNSSYPSPHRSKTHSRSNSIPSVNPASAIYLPSATPSSTSSRAHSRPTPKRSQSFSARTGAPSPLRFNTSGSSGSHHSDSGHKRDPLYRRASYKIADHCTYTLPSRLTTFTEAFLSAGRHPHSSGYGSSRSNSSSSILPGIGSASSSRRPSLSRSNQTWHGSQASSSGGQTPSRK